MYKIRCSLAAIALIVTLSGLSLQGLGAAAVANAAAVHHASSVSSALVVGKSAGSGNVRPYGPCPGGVTTDC
jgi:hypothetical protein